LPSDKEIRELQDQNPGLRVWGVRPSGKSDTSRLGDLPVVPFYDVVEALRAVEARVREEEREMRIADSENGTGHWFLAGCGKRHDVTSIYAAGRHDEQERHHKDACCRVCDTHVMPHRGCILR
jgi:hypothetical protein